MAYPLQRKQSRDLLQFCRSVGQTVFTVNFLTVKGEESEQRADAFYQKLSAFSAGERVLESLYGNGFANRECWVLNDESVEVILEETAGNLFAYNLLYLPEDWIFYVGESILLQVISHEQEATLRLSEAQYSKFTRLGIPHKHGQPQHSGLPETPIRQPPAR